MTQKGFIEVKSTAEYVDLISKIDYPKYTLFRGEKKDFKTSKLKPKIGRSKVYKKHKKDLAYKLEYQLLNWFKTELPQFSVGNKSDLEYLVIGQHHGLETRLLDFTLNPLVALYFAVEDENSRSDGFVYVVDEGIDQSSEFFSPDKKFNDLICEVKDGYHFFIPQRSFSRIGSQTGVFAFAKKT